VQKTTLARRKSLLEFDVNKSLWRNRNKRDVSTGAEKKVCAYKCDEDIITMGTEIAKMDLRINRKINIVGTVFL
jgi:hypothetical protein